MFVHRDIFHLLYNVIGQLTVGVPLEMVHGSYVDLCCLAKFAGLIHSLWFTAYHKLWKSYLFIYHFAFCFQFVAIVLWAYSLSQLSPVHCIRPSAIHRPMLQVGAPNGNKISHEINRSDSELQRTNGELFLIIKNCSARCQRRCLLALLGTRCQFDHKLRWNRFRHFPANLAGDRLRAGSWPSDLSSGESNDRGEVREREKNGEI